MAAWHYDVQNKLYQDIDRTEDLLDVILLILWLCTDCSERIQRKVKRHPCSACSSLNHLTLISDVSEALILASSFEWTIAIKSMKELL